jgi:hypothetical protein
VKNVARLVVLAVVPFLVLALAPAAQKIETVDGGRVVHNEKGGVWGKAPKVALELVRKIGDVDTEDEHVAFNYPSDVAVDRDGNIYILDSGNARIQKFGPDGKYLATIGRKGQGPGEFLWPDAIDIDRDGNLVVYDSSQARVQVIIGGGKDVRSITIKEPFASGLRALPSGEYAAKAMPYPMPARGQAPAKTSEMRLFRKIAADGRVTGSFGLLTDFGDPRTTGRANWSMFDVDGTGALCVGFTAQNRVEKYAPDGTLLWRADRPLAYGTEVKEKARVESSGGKAISVTEARMNDCSAGIAVDGRSRIWVVTYDRQLRKEEQVQTTMVRLSSPTGGVGRISAKTEGNTDLRTTDAFKLEVFSPDGVLLGELPLTHFADVIRIAGDSLFLIDRERGVTVYQYRIVEK